MERVRTILKVIIGIAVLYSAYSIGFAIHQNLILLDREIFAVKLREEIFRRDPAAAAAFEEERNDRYGGKTPEETWELFRRALTQNDIDLAVKYFAEYNPKKRQTIKEYYTIRDPSQVEKESSIELIVKSTNPTIQPRSDREEAFFYGTYMDQELGKRYSKEMVFMKNKYTGAWKIETILGE